MFRYTLVVLLLVSGQAMATPLQQDDIKDALAHAEVLYYEARFQDAIQLLSRIDTVLKPDGNRLSDKTNVKLQLALAHIGLNEITDAKQFLRELYALDPERRLDPLEFSPKVIALANEAKVEEDQNRCQRIYADAQKQLEYGNVPALVTFIKSEKKSCPSLQGLEPNAAELVYKTGLDAYKRGDYVGARKQFQSALQLSPKHEMASQYMELVDGKLQMGVERLFLDWQKRFDAHEFDLAAADYNQLKGRDNSETGALVNQIRGEYTNALSAQIDRWKLACSSGDSVRMGVIRNYVSQMLPEDNFATDLQAQMTCTASPTSCLRIDHQLAMTRLTTRVNPDINPALRSTALRTEQRVKVGVHIDLKGNVSVTDVQGSNPAINEAIKNAVLRWRFTPAVDGNGARCVDTEIPFVIHGSNPQ